MKLVKFIKMRYEPHFEDVSKFVYIDVCKVTSIEQIQGGCRISVQSNSEYYDIAQDYECVAAEIENFVDKFKPVVLRYRNEEKKCKDFHASEFPFISHEKLCIAKKNVEELKKIFGC